MKNDLEGSADMLGLPLDELFKEAYSAVEDEDIYKLTDIEILVKRYFCKKIAQFKIEELSRYNKLLVNFLAWFEWGGEPKWDSAVPIVQKLRAILEISQQIFDTETADKAYGKLKEIPRGEILISRLHEKKIMKTGEIKEFLRIKTKREVSKVLSSLEKVGIIIREVERKNVWVSLGMPGMAVYKKFIKPDEPDMIQIIKALRELGKKEFERAKEKLLIASGKESIALCLLGVIALENGELEEAGVLFTRASELGIDKGKIFLIFYILEIMGRLDILKGNS